MDNNELDNERDEELEKLHQSILAKKNKTEENNNENDMISNIVNNYNKFRNQAIFELIAGILIAVLGIVKQSNISFLLGITFICISILFFILCKIIKKADFQKKGN